MDAVEADLPGAGDGAGLVPWAPRAAKARFKIMAAEKFLRTVPP